jgi:hypothetical protein
MVAGSQGPGRQIGAKVDSSSPHTKFAQLAQDDPGPVAVCVWIGRAWMHYPRDLDVREGFTGATGSEIAHPDDPLGSQGRDRRPQIIVAQGIDSLAFARFEFIRSTVFPCHLHESEGTIIENQVFCEELPRVAEPGGEQSPQSAPAYF